MNQERNGSALVGALNSLQQQIDQLRAQVIQLQGGSAIEAGQPNYLTINPATGAIGANFTGLINALGIILPAGLTGPQPPQVATNQIVWQDTSNGVLVANIQGWNVPGNNQGVRVSSKAEADIGQNYATLSADQHSGFSGSATLQISQLNDGQAGGVGAIGGATEVDMFVGTHAAMLLDSANRSSFLQIGSIPCVTSWGSIIAGSSSISDPGSGDWGVLGTTTGATQIGFSSGASGTIGFGIGSYGGSRLSAGFSSSQIQISNGASPTISSWTAGVLTTITVPVNFIYWHV